jgi:hypothetical protein
MDKVLYTVFSDSKLPEFKKVSREPYISFGANNKYPDELLYLYNKSAKHNAIVNGKVKYIFGGGLTLTDDQDQSAKEWAANINPSESLSDLTRKTILDIELFGGFYWEVIPKLGGGFEIYYIPFKKIRTSENKKDFWYKSDWSDTKVEKKHYSAFHKDCQEASIFFFSEYRPNTEPYCLPGYVGSINYIESDIEVSKHTLTSAKKGWRPSKLINFYNGEPSPEKKREITNLLKDRTEGAEGETFIVSFNNDPLKKPTIDDLGVSELSKENFKNIDELISSNIYAGHEITSPALFGIKEAGQLGGTTELRNAYEIFKNTYANNKQQQLEKVINKFAALAGVQSKFKFVHSEPLGFEITEATILKAAPRSWILEKAGIDATKYTDAPVEGTLPPAPSGAGEQMVNDHLKNLTGRQQQQLDRILRKYDNQKLSKERASMLLKSSLGLTDEQVEILLGEDQFSAQYTEEEVAEMFSTIGQGRETFEIIDSKEVSFSSDKDAAEYELSFYQTFAETEDKKTADKIATNIPQISIKYSYEVRAGVGPAVIPTTRPFCKKLLELNRLYTRKEIEMISERLGYSVWDRKGGFWGHKPYCRHKWKSNIVIKK